jgi:hypothetical protein
VRHWEDKEKLAPDLALKVLTLDNETLGKLFMDFSFLMHELEVEMVLTA